MSESLPPVLTEQDWPALSRWLNQQGYEFDLDPARIGQFPTGLANLNYIVHLGDTAAVLRRPPAGDLPQGSNDMAREHRVLSALSTVYPLAPSPIVYCADPSIIGAPFQLMEYRPGTAIGSHVPKNWSAEQTAGLRHDIIRAMFDLHTLDPAAIGLSDLGRPNGFLDRQARFWSNRSEQVWDGVPPPPVQALVSAIRQRPAPVPLRTSVLHLDLKPENMLVDPVSAEPLAVIDWDMATIGDPRYDLAILMSYWIEPTDPESVLDLERAPSLDPGAGTRDDLVREYEAISQAPMSELGWFLAMARLRLSVIWRQLSLLSQEGQLIGAYYERCDRLAVNIAEWALAEFTSENNAWWA